MTSWKSRSKNKAVLQDHAEHANSTIQREAEAGIFTDVEVAKESFWTLSARDLPYLNAPCTMSLFEADEAGTSPALRQSGVNGQRIGSV